MVERARLLSRRRILVVDDHPDTRDMYAEVLASQGAAVTTFGESSRSTGLMS